MRVFLFLVFSTALTAQQPLAEQLMKAEDDATVAQLLAAADVSSVTPDLFEACRKAGQTEYEHREFPASLRDFKAALAVARRLQSDRSIAAALRGVGLALRRMDHSRQALAAYEEGLEAATRCGDLPLQAELLRGIGVSHRNQGEFPQAMEADERSIAIYRQLDDKHQAAAGLNNLAATYRLTGDLRRAGELWEESAREGRDFPDVLNSAISNLALVAGDLGNVAASRAYLEQTNRAAEKNHDWRTLAVGLINIGPSYRDAKEYDKALQIYKRALDLSMQVHDVMLQSTALVNRSAVYESLKQPQLAIADLEESLRVIKGTDSKSAKLVALSNLAPLELSAGKVDLAFEYARQAVAAAREYQVPEQVWPAFDALGNCWLAKKDRVQARSAFEQAIASIELLRSRAGGSEADGQYFLQSRITPYHDLLKLDLDEGLPEQALALAERAKARQLLDVLRRGKTQPAEVMTAAEVAEERRLSAVLSQLDQQAAGADTQKRMEQAQRQMEAFRLRVYLAHPGLAAQRGEAVPVTLAQSEELLPDAHTAIVEFVSTADTLYTFTVIRGASGHPALSTHAIRWPREELARDVEEFQAKLAARDLGYRDNAARLYKRLLGPLSAQLRESRLLVLVPDGPLWNLPFQALVAGDGKHLIERQSVFYAPSLTYLRENRRAKHEVEPAHQLLALGNPDTGDLPETAREVRELENLYGPAHSKTLLAGEALKANWRKEAPNYRVLHLATHGILNSKNPMYSYLVFSGKTGSDKLLEAREVVNMKLNPDLVVLSACETGRGSVSIGEGLVGMSWAFLLAGAPTTVVSQWKTDSASTTQLMIAMHASMKPVLASSQGVGRARSLQKAALALMQTPEYRHPFYWAGFVMVGEGY
jgi:CHAT domain-containing protein